MCVYLGKVGYGILCVGLELVYRYIKCASFSDSECSTRCIMVCEPWMCMHLYLKMLLRHVRACVCPTQLRGRVLQAVVQVEPVARENYINSDLRSSTILPT